jgi:high-affinity nickel-transport protein
MVGVVHGLAGSAFVAMLVLAAVPGLAGGLAYLVVFGVGTVAGMALITAGVALPATLTAARFRDAHSWVRVASGVASIVFGLALAHQVGVADGLFTSSPRWTPQ